MKALWRSTKALALALFTTLLVAGCSAGGDSRASSGTPASAGNLQITIATEPDPPKPGPVTITVELKDSAGKPVDGASIILYGGMPSMGHGGIEGELDALGSGRYQGKGTFSMAGRWRLDVEVNKDGMSSQQQSFNVNVVR